MSTLDRITDMLPKTAIVFPMNDPKKQSKELRSQWNAQCENLVVTSSTRTDRVKSFLTAPTLIVEFST